ncbi:MAG: ribosome-associated translation inhibitor RaiA [Candidatus Rhabdochlamydia sp.]
MNELKKVNTHSIDIHIVGRNVQVTDPMKEYVESKLSKIDRFHVGDMHVHAVMEVQKLGQTATFLLHVSHLRIKVSATTPDMYGSIDQAIEKLHEKIRRWKDKIQSHHQKPRSVIDMQVNVLKKPYSDIERINASIELENQAHEAEEYSKPHIVGTEVKPLKLLTTDEAVMKMELSDDQFIVFRGEEDLKLKVVYRRNDGHYGLLLPE